PDELALVIIERTRGIGISLGPGNMLGFGIVTAVHLTRGAMNLFSILILILHAKVVKLIARHMMRCASITQGFGRPGSHMPVLDIEFVDKLLHEVIARNPAKMLPVAQHILHVAPFRLSLNPPD